LPTICLVAIAPHVNRAGRHANTPKCPVPSVNRADRSCYSQPLR